MIGVASVLALEGLIYAVGVWLGNQVSDYDNAHGVCSHEWEPMTDAASRYWVCKRCQSIRPMTKHEV